jgi:hypothetical protein
MIVVIQCAASKRSDAGHLVTSSGEPVNVVADPKMAPRNSGWVYARPDDLLGNGTSWRQLLRRYNDNPGGNPLHLYPAYQLYQNKTYGHLVDRFGSDAVYILSAGWGLVRADYLLPYYDITFSTSVEAYKRRRKSDLYEDFRLLPGDIDKDMVFFGGLDYLPLFCSLTNIGQGRKTVFFNSKRTPQCNGYTFRRFETAARTNWHYECARAFLDGTIRI